MATFAELLNIANASPQPNAAENVAPPPVQVPQLPQPGFAGVTQPNPLAEIAVPATSPQEVEQRKQGWAQVWEKFQTDPNLRMMVSAIGAQLAQPRQYGQTRAGHISNALMTGQQVYNAGEYTKYQQGRELAKDTREEAESKARVAASTAVTDINKAKLPGVQAESQVEAATVEAKIKKAQAETELALTKAASAKDTEEVNKLQREEAKRIATLRKGITDQRILAEIDAEHQTVLQKLEVEKQRVATLKAQAAASGASAAEHSARAGKENLELETLRNMPPEERKQFLTKTGKYSTHTSGVYQQADLWGSIYDKLPETDPVKKGKTREQFQMGQLTSAKQKDVAETLTKYLAAGGDDKEIIAGMTELIKGNVRDKLNTSGATPAPAKDIAAEATKTWGKYDPNQYDYRIAPDGVIERKSKVKPITGAK